MTVRYYEDSEDQNILYGVCSEHGEFVGDAVGCPACLSISEADSEDEVEE